MARRKRVHNMNVPPSVVVQNRWGRNAFLGFLIVVSSVYAVVLSYHFANPRHKVVVSNDWMDCCRELFLHYGLIPTGHIANDAQAYLKAIAFEVEESANTEGKRDGIMPVITQKHPLLGHSAPNFELKDDRGKRHELRNFTANGPVVLVFYYGFHCSHCVAQLFAINDDIERFSETGATIFALSGDASELTSERMTQYGRFDFPVLSDRENKVAEKYGVYRPENGNQPEDLQHATFLIERGGIVVWAYRGTKPFIDNKSLISLLGKGRHAGSVVTDPTDSDSASID